MRYCQLRQYFVFVWSDLAFLRNFFQRPFQKPDPSDHFHMRSSSSATPVLLLPPIQTICLRSTTRVTRKLLVSRLWTEARSLLLQLWFASHPGPFTLQCALDKLTLTLLRQFTKDNRMGQWGIRFKLQMLCPQENV